MNVNVDYPPEVTAILNTLLAGMRERLGANLVGVYLRGSLALGDFEPAASDVDFFAVTGRHVSDEEFTALADMHEALRALPNPYGNHLEGPYIECAAAHRYQPGQRFPTIERNHALAWAEHGANWTLERWAVRERGVTLLGPDPQTLIAPISGDDLRAATRDRLRDWANFANQPDDPEWRAPLGHKAYVVETMCRTLHTLASGELQTKPQAVAWALATLPDPWRATVARSRAWHNNQTRDDNLNPEVRRFVLWAAAQGEG